MLTLKYDYCIMFSFIRFVSCLLLMLHLSTEPLVRLSQTWSHENRSPKFLQRYGTLCDRMPNSQSRDPGFESTVCYHFDVWPFSFSQFISISCINEYLTIHSCGNVSDLVFARNCCVARMLPREVELVSE